VTLQVRARLAARIRGFYAILDADDEGLAAALVDPAVAAPVRSAQARPTSSAGRRADGLRDARPTRC
jgi:hypothetical protein